MKGLVTNIIHTKGWQCLQEQLQEQGHNEVPYEYIIQLMDIILHNNIFILPNALWKQEVGAAMSSTLLYIERENNQSQLSGFLEKGGWLMTTSK